MSKEPGALQIEHNPDYNGAHQDGIAMSQATISGGRRMSTANCYLDPIRNRTNLDIQTSALTECLLLDGARCIGVQYRVGNEVREARAGRDVVVSGGSVNSPQLLELSGIGQAERLRELGIEVRHAFQVSVRICVTILHRAHGGLSARGDIPLTREDGALAS